MHFAPTDEQNTLQEVARDFLAANPTPAWEQLIEEQGWQAIAIPEEYGGFGCGFVELALVAEEIGRALAPVPLLSHTLASHCIATAGDEAQKQRWLPELAAGTRATAARGTLRATRTSAGWHIVGEATRTIDGVGAQLVVVQTGQGLFVVEDGRFEALAQPSLDPTRPLAKLKFDTEVGEEARLGGANLSAALTGGWVLLAAEATGVAEACMDASVAYAKIRVQYGKAIGSFQAIQHKCADLLLLVESARSATWYAAWAVDAEAKDADLAARTARAYAGDAAFRCAADNIQVHGGVGFTWEHSAHRYFKRARADQALLGHPRSHRAAVAEHLLGAL